MSIEQHQHYLLVSKLLFALQKHKGKKPSLAELSQLVDVSESHLQRVFSEWVGVSPNKFLQYLDKERAKAILKEKSVMDAADELGLSASSRLYDLMITWEGVTPGEYKSLGKGLRIEYGTAPSPFGMCFMAFTERGVCALAFYDSDEEEQQLLFDLKRDWANAELAGNEIGAKERIDRLFLNMNSSKFESNGRDKQSLHLLLKGSEFQIKVWEALLKLPEASLASYGDLAQIAGKPQAVRAVSSAVAKNRIALLIPCHRVIRKGGEFNQYRWGALRKQAMIAHEASRQDSMIKNQR